MNARIIEVRDLRKRFRAKQKQAGLRGSFTALVRPEFREIEAVSGISFDVNPHGFEHFKLLTIAINLEHFSFVLLEEPYHWVVICISIYEVVN